MAGSPASATIVGTGSPPSTSKLLRGRPVVIQALNPDSSKAVAYETVSGIWTQEIRALVRQSVERIVIHSREIEIVLRDEAADECNTPNSPSKNSERPRGLRIPRPKVHQNERKVIFVPGTAGSASHHIDKSLVLAVARGRDWVSSLRRGDYADTAKIAEKFKLSEPYVRRTLRLAFLAPEIVAAIAGGRQPRTLSLEKLLSPLPLSCDEQRRALGFPQ